MTTADSTKEIFAGLSFPEGTTIEILKKHSVAVLISGGVDSAFLVCALTNYFAGVHPVYVRFGLHWEKAEYQCLLEYLHTVKRPGIKAIKVLDMPIDNIYGSHWSTTGDSVPDASSDDREVYLPGRNLLLLTKTAVWCTLNNISHIAIGCLGGNPFPDADPKFFDQLQSTLTMGLNFNITVLHPLLTMGKHEIIQMAKNLPLHLTFSCINPIISRGETALHCGNCNKCAERQKAFTIAQVEDRTIYASSLPAGSMICENHTLR